MSENIQKLIAIVGPTASGKTGVGVQLAKKIGGEIISADSRQIYKGLDIGSGKDLKTYDNVVYHLIDIADPGERLSLFDWLGQARVIIEDIFSRGKIPVVVGGTGLYVSALVEGYQSVSSKSKVQSSKLTTKQHTRQELDEMPLEELQVLYRKLITDNRELDENNPRRIIRAIEKAQSGEEVEKVKPDFESLTIALDLDREELYKKIDQRADQRFEEGMLEETRNLLLSCHSCESRNLIASHDKIPDPIRQAQGVSEIEPQVRDDGNKIDRYMADWLISLGLDYKHMTQYLLDNGIDAPASGAEFEKMVEQFKFAEHDYARRQLIWWRKKDVQWAKSYQEVELIAKKFVKSAA